MQALSGAISCGICWNQSMITSSSTLTPHICWQSGESADVADDPNYVFVKADIRDGRQSTGSSGNMRLNGSSTSRGISRGQKYSRPDVFLTTNVIGTQVLLDTARSIGRSTPMTNIVGNTNQESNLSRFQRTKYMAILAQQGSLSRQCPCCRTILIQRQSECRLGRPGIP